MMIRTEILKTIPEPWFLTTDDDEPPEGYTIRRGTDDIYFCERVKEAGFKILADANVLCVHWDYEFDPAKPYYMPMDSYPMQGVTLRPVMTEKPVGVQ